MDYVFIREDKIDYVVGDMVKDVFNRVYIVIALNSNNNQVYNVSLSQVAGKPVPAFLYDNKGYVRVFPTDVSKL